MSQDLKREHIATAALQGLLTGIALAPPLFFYEKPLGEAARVMASMAGDMIPVDNPASVTMAKPDCKHLARLAVEYADALLDALED